MAKIPDPYEHTEFRGRPLDYATAAFFVDCEVELGYRLTLLQGIGGAPASSGTHLLGRAGDLAPYDGHRKSKVSRDKGGAGWEREALAGVWGEHVHVINIFESRENRRGLAPAGFDQIGKYDRLEDGLANPPTPDPFPYRPSPKVVFTRARYEFVMTQWGLDGGPMPTRITAIRDALVEEDADIGKIISMMRPLADNDSWKREIKVLQKDRTRIRRLLDEMPKR